MKAQEVDVAIIGGGIIGCATAWYLTKLGMRVAVIEKGRIAGEQSSRNSGFIRKQGRDERELPLIIRSLELWREIQRETGEEVGLVQAGNLAITDREDKLEKMIAWTAIAKRHGLESKVLDPSQLREICPQLRPGFLGGLYTADDLSAEPELATSAIASALRRAGGIIEEQCHAQGLLFAAGKVAGVRTEKGEFRADKVVVAGGLWSGLFLRRYGAHIPQSDLRITVAKTVPFEHGVTTPMWLPDCLVRPRRDGGLTIALGQASRADYDPTFRSLRHAGRFLPTYLANRKSVRIRPGRHSLTAIGRDKAYLKGDIGRREDVRVQHVDANLETINQCAAFAQRDLQFNQPLQLEKAWACRADMTPDGIPVIGELAKAPGAFVATGMSGHGFGISLGVGEAVAQMLVHGTSEISLANFKPERFVDRYFVAPQNVL